MGLCVCVMLQKEASLLKCALHVYSVPTLCNRIFLRLVHGCS